MAETLIITFDDLHTPQVEATLREHKQIAQTKEHYETARVVGRVNKQHPSIMQRAAVYLTLFGLAGGLLGWAFGQVLHLRPDIEAVGKTGLLERDRILAGQADGSIDAEVADFRLQDVTRVYGGNPFFRIETRPGVERRRTAGRRVGR